MEIFSNLLALNEIIAEGYTISFFQLVLRSLVVISALCIAMPVHEWAHAYVAYKQGDPTAKYMGRMTLAPHAHFNFWGFICLYIFGFGWAKPVPVDERNFKNGKRSSVMVSLAGVTANLITGTIFIIIATALANFVPNYATAWGLYGDALSVFLSSVISINFALAFFNILPIYPLDGFRVVETFAKPNSGFVNFMRRYSNIILIVIILFSYLLELYLAYTAGGLVHGLTWLFDKFWGLFI